MNDSILIFNQCHNKQLLLASVTIHTEYIIHTPTQLGNHYCRYFSFHSDQTKLGTDVAGLNILYNSSPFPKYLLHRFICGFIYYIWISQTLSIYVIVHFSINIWQIMGFLLPFFFLLRKGTNQFYCGCCVVSWKALQGYNFSSNTFKKLWHFAFYWIPSACPMLYLIYLKDTWIPNSHKKKDISPPSTAKGKHA